MSGLSVFDKTTEMTQMWVNQVASELKIDDKHLAFQGLRATLHVLRDRLTLGEAANLGAQLPILLAGFYYEGWRPEQTPTTSRSQAEFLDYLEDHLHHYFPKQMPNLNVEQLARAVFHVMANHITPGELAEVKSILPADVKDLFPQVIKA